MTTLDDLVKQSELVQRHMDAISNLLHLAAVTKNINQFGAIKIVMEYESRQMSRDSDRLNQMMNEYRNQVASESQEEKKDNMKRNVIITLALLVLMLVLVSGIPAVAQSDVPLATNTPAEVIGPVVATLDGQPVEATLVAPVDEPPVVVVENPPSDRTIYVVGVLIFLAFTGFLQVLNHKQIGGFKDSINKALDNKQVLDEARQRYMEASMTTQEYAKLLTNIAGFVGAMIPGDDVAERLKKFGDQVISGPVPTQREVDAMRSKLLGNAGIGDLPNYPIRTDDDSGLG